MMKQTRWMLAIAVGATACGSAKPRVEPASRFETSPVPIAKTDSTKPVDSAPPNVPSHIVTTVGPRTIGPYYARSSGGSGGIVAYIGNGEAGARRLVTVPVGDDGATRGEARFIPRVSPDAVQLIVRGGSQGYFAGYTAVADRGEVLVLVGLGADGAPKGPLVDLARTHDHLAWFEIVPTAKGAVCVWAEETRVRDANVFAVALDADGKPRGVTSRVASGVTGWQAIPAGGGVGLALVAPADGAGAKGGALTWRRLDADARAVGNPSPIATKVGSDVDVVASAGGFLFAWTDRSGEDAEVYLAAVDEAGKVTAPRHAMEAIGGSALVGLAAGRGGVVLAWDDPRRRGATAARRVRLSRVVTTSGLETLDVSSVEVHGKGAPELVATTAGFAMLFYGQTCVAGATGDKTPPAGPLCPADTPIAPTFVRFDAQLAPMETQPFRVGEKHDAATIGWGLDCTGERCLALAATSENPTPVRVVDLAARSTPFRAPIVAPPPANAPRVTALKTITAGETFSDVAAVRAGDAALVASLTTAVDDPAEARHQAAGATLAVRLVDEKGDTRGAPVTLSRRALPVGGVAMAAGGKPEDGAAIAWVTRDNGDPQVHLTRVSKTGRQLNTVQLTGTKGDASDVAIAWAGGGWVVAWVDGRDGNGEVYACKVDLDLNRTSREERITNAPGDAGDVTLLAQGDRVWLAWADPRESPKDGFGDIYVTSVSTRNAKQASEEIRVMASAAHSRSPSLAMASDGLMLGWVEEAPMGLDTANMASYGAMLARLDDRGRVVREPQRAPVAGPGRATAIALDGERGFVRAYVARSVRDELVLDAFDAARDDGAYSILNLDSPGSLDLSIAVLGDALYFNDHGAEPGERRLRRATVLWRR